MVVGLGSRRTSLLMIRGVRHRSRTGSRPRPTNRPFEMGCRGITKPTRRPSDEREHPHVPKEARRIEAMRLPEAYPPGVDPSSDDYARNIEAANVLDWLDKQLPRFDPLTDQVPASGGRSTCYRAPVDRHA
ncbi:hypothetical protein GS528_16485 [Rhodococcus hoagii]|nr:hypothetical protein [Prescottella equi]